MLLGSSSAEQFLLVLAEEDISRASDFLNVAAHAIAELSHGSLRLVWATTENLGTWPVARKRLDDALLAKTSAPLSDVADVPALFTAFPSRDREGAVYFSSFAANLPSASKVGWSRENPAHLTWDEGQYSWPLKEQSRVDDDAILYPRRFALDDVGGKPSSVSELAARAEGTPRWGILRGDVDQFETLLRRAATIEEHIHLSALYKEFFAGELALLCTLPDFWRKITILYRGGDDFAVIGAWDALVMMAREIQRLFEKFTEQNVPSTAGLEGKSISMALSMRRRSTRLLQPHSGTRQRNCVARKPEKQARSICSGELSNEAAPRCRRIEGQPGAPGAKLRLSPEAINDLASVYREAYSARAARRGKAVEPRSRGALICGFRV